MIFLYGFRENFSCEIQRVVRAGKRAPSCPLKKLANRPRSIYQYSNMAPRLSVLTSIFGAVFFVSKSLLGIERQKKLENFAILTRKPRSHAWILIYRTWPIVIAHDLQIRNLVPRVYHERPWNEVGRYVRLQHNLGRYAYTYGIGYKLDWTLDSGLWTLDSGLWTLDSGLWAS